jgi:hypothetical protein
MSFIWFCTICIGVIFQFLTMFNTIVGAGAVGAGAALRYGSGSDQKMRLRLWLRPRNTDFYTVPFNPFISKALHTAV